MSHVFQNSDAELLSTELEKLQPQTILLLGARSLCLCQEYLQKNPQVLARHAEMSGMPMLIAKSQEFDCIVMTGVLEHLSRPEAWALLDQLALLSSQILLRVPLGKAWLRQVSFWEPQNLRSKGFELLTLLAEGGKPLGIFHYNGKAYKTNAEWLNSKYWAQPD